MNKPAFPVSPFLFILFSATLVIFLFPGCRVVDRSLPYGGRTEIHIFNNQGEDLLNPTTGIYKEKDIIVYYSSLEVRNLSKTHLFSDAQNNYYFLISTAFGETDGSKIIPEGSYSVFIDYGNGTDTDTLNYTVKYFDNGGVGWSDVTLDGKPVDFLSGEVSIELVK